MATVNGIGTMRYDWSRRPDGTAEATLWFVIFFLPVAPLRREHLRVVSAGAEPASFLSAVAAIGGGGSGWKTEIEVLGEVQNSPWRVLRTYVKGLIGVPFVTFVGPMLLFVLGLLMTLDRRAPAPEWLQIAAPLFGLAVLLWTACVIARILDQAAGRFHIDNNVAGIERRRRTRGSTAEVRDDPEPEPAPPKTLFHRIVGWIAAILCVIFSITAVACLVMQQFQMAIGGVIWTALFGWVARDWLGKGTVGRDRDTPSIGNKRSGGKTRRRTTDARRSDGV